MRYMTHEKISGELTREEFVINNKENEIKNKWIILLINKKKVYRRS